MCKSCKNQASAYQYVAIIRTVDGLIHYRPINATEQYVTNAVTITMELRAGFTYCRETEEGNELVVYDRADILGPITLKLAKDIMGWDTLTWKQPKTDTMIELPSPQVDKTPKNIYLTHDD